MGGGGVKVPLVFFTLSVAWAHLGLTPVSSCTLVLGSPSHRSSFFISIWHFGDPEFLWTGSPSSGSQESLRSEPFWNRVWPGLDAQSCAAHGGAERDFYTHVGTPLSRPSSLAPPLRPSRSLRVSRAGAGTASCASAECISCHLFLCRFWKEEASLALLACVAWFPRTKPRGVPISSACTRRRGVRVLRRWTLANPGRAPLLLTSSCWVLLGWGRGRGAHSFHWGLEQESC